jgi:enamine deaminase RidA (YjgF/YER057c/UK114 family)
MQQHYVRPGGLPPVNGYSHAVVFSGRMVAISGQVPLDEQGRLAGDEPEIDRDLTATVARAASRHPA